MTLKKMVCNYKKSDNDFIFIRTDTLIERLKRMRALNSCPADIGITQYSWKRCSLGEKPKD